MALNTNTNRIVKFVFDMSEIKPYSGGDDKRTQVEQMFDGIASKYDVLNHVLSFGIDRGWRTKSISMLSDRKPHGLLDVATGTADFAIEAHRALGCDVLGCDISAEMIELGRAKVAKASLEDKIKLLKADSAQLPFSTNRFDAVSVAFGVRNFADLDRGLKEMARVLKPGGRMVVLEFSTPSNALFRAVYKFYFRYILPLVGGIVSSDMAAYKYLCRSSLAFPSGAAFEEHLVQAGLRPISRQEFTMGISTAYLAQKI